jgi:predicted PurR-regulated permease PerM
MLGIDARAARASWTAIVLLLLLAAAYAIRETLAVFVIALLFAYLLAPLVGLVERFTPRQVSPRFALAIVYLVLIGVIIALASTVGSRLVDEANSLASQLPALLKSRAWMQLPLPVWLEPARDRIIQTVQNELNSSGQQILPYVRSLGGHLVSGAKYALYMVLIPILAFFFLKDGTEIRESLVAGLFEEERRPIVDDILGDINRLLGEYIRALVLLSLAAFTANAILLGATGAAYAILLAGVAGIAEFIPVVGPAAAGIVILLVTGLSGYSHLLLYVIFWIVFRLVQDYALSPYLMGKGVQLNPLLVLFGVLAGEQLAGIVGMFLSVPALAVLRVVFLRLRRGHAGELVAPRAKA